MSALEADPKFRRILLVHQTDEPHDWLELLRRYASDVVLVSLNNPYASDYLEMPADCVVIDSRIEDLTGGGMVVGQLQGRSIPHLVMVDQRFTPEDLAQLRPDMYTSTHLVRYWPRTATDEVEKFLEETEPFDYAEVWRTAPWLLRPWTVTLAQTMEAISQGGTYLPLQLGGR